MRKRRKGVRQGQQGEDAAQDEEMQCRGWNPPNCQRSRESPSLSLPSCMKSTWQSGAQIFPATGRRPLLLFSDLGVTFFSLAEPGTSLSQKCFCMPGGHLAFHRLVPTPPCLDEPPCHQRQTWAFWFCVCSDFAFDGGNEIKWLSPRAGWTGLISCWEKGREKLNSQEELHSKREAVSTVKLIKE